MKLTTSRVGEQHINNQGYRFEITEYRGCMNCDIMFENGYLVNNVEYSQILRKEIRNPYHKTKYNVGFLGEGRYNSKTHVRAYDKWSNMFMRSYDTKYIEKFPTYKGCTVDKNWHNFQVFAQWFEENLKSHMKDWDLDKDILVKGNKIYSPETCCLIPTRINKLFTSRKNNRGALPVGVSKIGNKFKANLSKNGYRLHLGTYNTPKEAFLAYKTAKENYIKEVADEYKNKIDYEVYQAMYGYQVEITD